MSEMSLEKPLKQFGFDKLIPFLAAFVLLLVLDIVGTIVVTVGSVVPPTLGYNHEIWLLQHMGDPDVRCLATSLGENLDLTNLQRIIERTVNDAREAHKDSSVLALPQRWTEKEWEVRVAFYYCKFFFLYTVFLTVWELTRTRKGRMEYAASAEGSSQPTLARVIRRSLVCLLVFSIATGIFFFFDIYAIERQEEYQTRAAWIYMPSNLFNCDSTYNKEIQINYQQSVMREGQKYGFPRHWWFVKSEPNSDFIAWLKSQF
jgi:hypothetical protein